MNRDQFQQKTTGKEIKENNEEDGEKANYFDCTVLDKLQGGNGPNSDLKTDTQGDLMDLISKSDFSTVGGKNNQA